MQEQKIHQKAITGVTEAVLDVTQFGMPTYPIPANEIIHMLGGTITYKKISDTNKPIAITVKKHPGTYNQNEFMIILDEAVKQHSNTSTERYMLAKSIGILILHMGFSINEKRWNETADYMDSVYHRIDYRNENPQSHYFARNLLMPEAEFKNIANAHLHNGVYTLTPMSDYFDVSLHQIKVRGYEVGLFNTNTNLHER